MGLNKELIQRRFQDIRQSLERLERFRAISLESFLNDEDSLDVACYRLLVAIEAAIQICFHISARQLHRVPEEYAECFATLAEKGIIDLELGAKLQRMARFRNMLVHVYWEVDHCRLHSILQENLGDLRSFVRHIGALL